MSVNNVVALFLGASASKLMEHAMWGALQVAQGFLFRTVHYNSSVDANATRAACEFVADTHTFASKTLSDAHDSRPEGYMLSLSWGWLAVCTISPGDAHWETPTMTELYLLWPRWRTLPPALLTRRVKRKLPAGAVRVATLNIIETHTANWEKAYTCTVCPSDLPEAAHTTAEKLYERVRASKYQSTCAYLSGPTGTGKTVTPMLLAIRLGATYVDSYDFTNRQHRLTKLIRAANPSEDRPLVINVSEADVRIIKAIRLSVSGDETDSETRPDVHDKGSLNTFLEAFGQSSHMENVILVISGNTPFRHLETELSLWLSRSVDDDISCTRRGRMHPIGVGGDRDCERSETPLLTPFKPSPALRKYLRSAAPRQTVGTMSSCLATPSICSRSCSGDSDSDDSTRFL